MTKTRMSIMLPTELMEKLETYCNSIGMTRQSFVAYLIGTTLETKDALIKQMGEAIVQDSEGKK